MRLEVKNNEYDNFIQIGDAPIHVTNSIATKN